MPILKNSKTKKNIKNSKSKSTKKLNDSSNFLKKNKKKIAIATLGLAALGAGVYVSKSLYGKKSVEKAKNVLSKFNGKYGGWLPTWLGGNKSASPKIEKLAIELEQTINNVEELKNQPEKKNELQKEAQKMEIQKNKLEKEIENDGDKTPTNGDITPKARHLNKSVNPDELKLKLQLEKYNKEIEELEEKYSKLEEELDKTSKNTNKYKALQRELKSIDNKEIMLNNKKMIATRNIEKINSYPEPGNYYRSTG